MAGHAQLKFVMTECSKTQIRLTGLKCAFMLHCAFAFVDVIECMIILMFVFLMQILMQYF